MIKYNSNIIWRKIRQCSIIFGHEFESELKKTGGNDLIKVAGQIEVQETIFTWYPAKPSESPECSSCSSDIEQFDEKNKCLCPFCVHPLCASLCRFSCISIVSACGEFKSPADFCILYSIFFSPYACCLEYIPQNCWALLILSLTKKNIWITKFESC